MTRRRLLGRSSASRSSTVMVTVDVRSLFKRRGRGSNLEETDDARCSCRRRTVLYSSVSMLSYRNRYGRQRCRLEPTTTTTSSSLSALDVVEPVMVVIVVVALLDVVNAVVVQYLVEVVAAAKGWYRVSTEKLPSCTCVGTHKNMTSDDGQRQRWPTPPPSITLFQLRLAPTTTTTTSSWRSVLDDPPPMITVENSSRQ